MKLIDNILYLEFPEMVECGVPENTLKNAKLRKSKSWSFIDDPDDKRRVLIDYEKLKDDYKKKVEARFGNPYEYVAKLPIRRLVKWDDKAEEFYLSYRYGENKPLPVEHVKKYTLAASWLNMFKAVNEDKKALKKLLNLTIEQFYTHAIEIINAQHILDAIDQKIKLVNEARAAHDFVRADAIEREVEQLKVTHQKEKIGLPTSYRRLVVAQDSALKKYQQNGYESLIDWRFGNKIAAKVKDELAESTLLEMLAHPDQYDDVYINIQYNKWAKKNGYKTIDKATVGHWRRKREAEITMEREGNAELKNRFLRQAKGFRPSAPLYLVESDDNHLDLLFLDPENPKATPRYIAIVVTDSYNDYVLGYAYALAGNLSEGQSIALIKAAYVNAMYYVRSITGNWHLPHETKTDNWAIKSLKPFYESIGKYIQTPVGSKNRGYIENMFGSAHWKRCLKIGANNYVGNNMTAKFRGVNVDAVARNKKDRPLIGAEAHQQIENFFHRLRHLPQSNGVSKHDQWMQAFNAMPEKDKRMITDEQFLLKFGVEHNENGRTIRITNRGVEPQIAGVRYSYDLEGASLIEHVGKAVKVIYDPFDMSRVLVTDFEKVRLIGREARLNPRALHDADTDSRTYLNSILLEKQQDVEAIAQRSERRKQILASAGLDAESLLQEGVLVKEIRQAAEQRMIAQTIDPSQDDDDIYNQM